MNIDEHHIKLVNVKAHKRAVDRLACGTEFHGRVVEYLQKACKINNMLYPHLYIQHATRERRLVLPYVEAITVLTCDD